MINTTPQHVLTVLLILVLVQSCSSKPCNDKRIAKIGDFLMSDMVSKSSRSSSPDIVFLGDGIIKQLQTLKEASKPYHYTIRNGDLLIPYGDNSADCILTIVSGQHSLQVRLGYNKKLDKYDIKGWLSNRPLPKKPLLTVGRADAGTLEK